MSSPLAPSSSRYDRYAYDFVYEALRFTQNRLNRGLQSSEAVDDDESAHISGSELLHGIKDYAIRKFGYLAQTVFQQWGITATIDFGNIVFEMIEKGEMRKTDRDSLEDFKDVYQFQDVFEIKYEIDASKAFRRLRQAEKEKESES